MRRSVVWLLIVGGALVAAGCTAGGEQARLAPAAPPEPASEPAEYGVAVHEIFDESGTLITRMELLADADGNPIYDEDGALIEHGVLTNFWPNGQKKSELHMVHGVRHGPRTSWYENGQMWISGHFVNGREHGVWNVWYPTGQKAQEYTFEQGAWHGTFTEWHMNGQMRRQVEYVRGLRQGKETFWDEDGRVVREIEYHDNVPQP